MYSIEDWSVMLDFVRVVLNGEEKRTNYKTLRSNEIKCGYSWKNPADEATEECRTLTSEKVTVYGKEGKG